jgi:class 3 adenylate cyclase
MFTDIVGYTALMGTDEDRALAVLRKKQDLPVKIGIHEGEMVFTGDDVLGDGVNIASGLLSVASLLH